MEMDKEIASLIWDGSSLKATGSAEAAVLSEEVSDAPSGLLSLSREGTLEESDTLAARAAASLRASLS